jgi:tetratricopeptide (TPR) repeat protein
MPLTDLTIDHLWSALNEEEISQGCIALMEPCHSVLEARRQAAMKRISDIRNIRINSIRAYSPEKNAALFLKFVRNSKHQDFWDDIVQAFLLGPKLEVVADFLGGASIKHEKGMIDDDEKVPSTEKFSEAIRSIRSKHSSRIQAIYFGYLIVYGGGFFTNLPAALEVEKFDLFAGLKSDNKASSTRADDAVSQDSAEPSPTQSSPGLTALDATLIKTIVASAVGADGALPEDQLEDVIDEVITMGSARKQSFYHRGFFHVLFDHPLKFSFDGDNAERRSWYFAGVVDGFLRRGKTEEMAELLKSHPNIFEEACVQQSCNGPILLTRLYKLLLDKQEFHLFRGLLRNQFPRLRPYQQLEIAREIRETASEMLRNGQSAEAESVLREIGALGQAAGSKCAPKIASFWLEFDARNARKVAQCLQMKGEFKGAEKILLSLLNIPDYPAKGRVLCDMGLIRGKFRSLKQIFPPKDNQSCASLCSALKEGQEFYQRAVEEDPEDSANARFCIALGLILEKKDAQAAVDHLQTAYSSFLLEEKAYTQAGVLQWTKFLLGLSLLESADESSLHYATELLEQSKVDPIVFPLWLWERAMTASSIFTGAILTTDIAIHFIRKGGTEAYQKILQSGIVHSAPMMRATYIPMLPQLSLTAKERWNHLENFLDASNSEKNSEEVEAILDQMECIAQSDPKLRPNFLDILQDSDKISLVWTPQEVAHTIIDLHERSGDWPQAISLLQNLFYAVRAESDERRKKVELLDILDWLVHLKADAKLIADLQDRAFGDDVGPICQVPEAKEAPISLLYIGGNETQRQYEQTLKNEFAQEHPSWALEFYFPGWTSNWNDHLNAVKPKIRTSDAVILNTLVRTQFGRHVRKTCDSNTPWFPCTGRGRASLKRSIEEAACWASQQKHTALN